MVGLRRELLGVGERKLSVGDELEDELEGQRGEVYGRAKTRRSAWVPLKKGTVRYSQAERT